MKRNILLISIIIALFVISGCITEDNIKKDTSDKSTVIVKSDDINIPEEPEPTIIDEVEEVIEPITDQLDPAEMLDKELANGYKLTDDELTALKEKVKKGSDSAFLTTSYPAGLSYGEYHVFPLGLTNLDVKEQEYIVEIEFLGAKDSKNNPIDKLNQDEILGWFRNNHFEILTLSGVDVAYMPVGVAINSKQPAGLYNFYAVVKESEIGSGRWQDINSKIPFTVRVKE